MTNWLARYPTTIGLFIVTAFVTALQFVYPGLLTALERSPAILDSGEWWRIVTALFINRGDGVEIALNLTGTLVVGLLAESRLSSLNCLIFYVATGIVGEVAGLAWKPVGAGTSVAFLGLLGSLSAIWLFNTKNRMARIGAGCILLTAIGLTFLHNLHGPPMIAGACLQALMSRRRGTFESRAAS